jgi:hypothetical protein
MLRHLRALAKRADLDDDHAIKAVVEGEPARTYTLPVIRAAVNNGINRRTGRMVYAEMWEALVGRHLEGKSRCEKFPPVVIELPSQVTKLEKLRATDITPLRATGTPRRRHGR